MRRADIRLAIAMSLAYGLVCGLAYVVGGLAR